MNTRPEPNWNEPIVWHDGTPTEIVPGSDRWGKIGVYADPNQMPTGVRFNGHPFRDTEGRPYISIIKCNGIVADPASSLHGYIENAQEEERRSASEAIASW